MTDLQQRIAAVRAAWRRTEMLKGASVLAADAVIIVFALVAIDALYHLPQNVRLAGLAAGALAIAAASLWVLVRPLQRSISDDELALYVEGRYPELKGSLIAAVEYERRPARDGIQSELVDALTVDCLQRASHVDMSRVIDRKRLARRAMLSGGLLLFLLGAVAVKPDFFGHEMARVLTPWVVVKATAAELQREREEEDQRRLIEEAARAQVPPKIELTVEPGNADVPRGGALQVRASANRVTGPMLLKFRSSDGKWRPLPMPEDPAQPEKFFRSLTDITEDLEYQVEMAGNTSGIFKIGVFDRAEIKELRLTYRYPKYMGLADKTVSGMDGTIEAVEGTAVDVTLVASGPLKSGQVDVSGQNLPMEIKGMEASATLNIIADGDYAVTGRDARGATLSFPTRFSIKAIHDDPPKIEIVYPTLDTEVHPMEEITFAAKAEDTVGLKEVRLLYYFNQEKEEVLRVPCASTTGVVKEKLAELMVPLKARGDVKAGDTILFHFEAEDLKGQVTSSDVYTIAVHPWESWSAYGYHSVMPAHGYGGPELINVIGAAWDLATKRASMSPEKFKQECEKIGRALEKPAGR